ncbi:MAG: choice-of-anchor V domain-containing protein [Candidatus Kapaibacteriota bacterium]
MKFILLLCLTLILCTINSSAYPGGIQGRLLSASGGCGDCHGGSPSSLTTVSIKNKTGSFIVKPGEMIELSAEVAHPSKLAAGINIGVKTAPNNTISIGKLGVISGQGLKKSSQKDTSELVQSAPKNMTNGKSEFIFTWTAPTQEGIYYLMATGNAVNRNGGDSGDEWNFMQPIQLTVTNTTGIHESSTASMAKMYPNPMLEYSMLDYELQESSPVSISVISTLGITVFSQDLGMQEHGKHNVGLWGLHSILPTGHYMLSIQTRLSQMSIPFIKQ